MLPCAIVLDDMPLKLKRDRRLRVGQIGHQLTSSLGLTSGGRGENYSNVRAIALAIIVLMLGGCMQETLAPTTQAGWSARDKHARTYST